MSPVLTAQGEAGCQTKSADTFRSDEPRRCSDAPETVLVGTPVAAPAEVSRGRGKGYFA